MTTAGDDPPHDLTPRRVRLLLPALLTVSLAYPVIDLHPAAAIAYVVIYIALLALAARVAAVSHRRRRAATAVAGVIALLSVPWIMFQDIVWLTLAVYALLVLFHLMVIAAIGEYLLEAHEVDVDVLFAGTSLYVLIGDMFIPAAMIVNVTTVALTGAPAYVTDGAVTWQQMTYFSFATLTTLGYGDILPATSPAQALAVAEAVLGVLTVALIIGRLVGSVATLRAGRRRS